MEKALENTGSASRIHMLVVEFLRRVVEVHERIPAQVLEFDVNKRDKGPSTERDPDQYHVQMKLCLLFHNKDEFIPFCSDKNEYFFTADIEAIVLVDPKAAIYSIVIDRYMEMKITFHQSFCAISGYLGRWPQEAWTIMMRRKEVKQTLGPVFEFCIQCRNPVHTHWMVGTSHQDVQQQTHYSSAAVT